MKKYNDLSVKVRVPVMMGVAGFIVCALIFLTLLFPLRSGALNNSSKIAQLSAVEAGNHLAERINGITNIVRAFSGIVAYISETDIVPNERKREMVLKEMEMMVKTNDKLNNVWCTFEPNALDGMDSLFVHQTGSDFRGVFSPWFIDGELIMLDSDDYEEEYYVTPKETGQEFITEPYWDEVNGKEMHMISVSIPVMLNGNFLGVAGTDFYVAELNQIIADLNQNSVGKLITDKGTVAVYHDVTRIGQEAEHGNREILDRLPGGKMFEGFYRFEDRDVYKVYVPIQLGEGVSPWFYAVDVPKEDIYAEASKIVRLLLICCTLAVLLIAFAGWILVHPVMKGVSAVTGILRQLSLGHINMHIDEHQDQDEIGKMKSVLRLVVNDMKKMADFAQNIGHGNLDAEFQVLSGDDILGNSLLEMRKSLKNAENEQKARAKEEEQRNWATAGLAKFAEILRKDNDNMDALSYNIISNMVKYLGANQGGIFVWNDDDKLLEMKACYAFDRNKFADKQIHSGEGLVGTCYLEGQSIYMTDIPNSYINITSGLGESNPKAIFICPLKVNDRIYGVIELASFLEFEPYQLDFVQKVSESIAVTISTVNVNIRTSRLLQQTKLQAEEMANQEEELRQNMEEMQATQEEMRRREAELNEIIEKMREAQIESK